MALSSSPSPKTRTGSNAQVGPEQSEQTEPPGTGGGQDQALGADQDFANAPSVTISNERGSVQIRFDADGVARLSADGQEGEFDLVRGTGTGVRLGEDGRLEAVPPGEFGPDDLGFSPTEQGVDVMAPNSPLVELRPDGRSGGVSATEFDGWEANQLNPDDGQVTLGDGTTISPIEAPGEDTAIIGVTSPADMPWREIFVAIALLALVSAATGWLLHRNHVEPDLLSTPTVDWATDVTEDFETFLRRLESDPDPTRAIRLAFHAIEQGVGGLPMRQENETPFEWHRRTADTVPTIDETLGAICDLYAKARFAAGQGTEQDRQDMIAQLRHLLHHSHTPVPA